MAAVHSIYIPALAAPREPCSLQLDIYSKNNRWGPPVAPATRFSSPSSSSSSASSASLTLYEDEDGWYDFCKADVDSLASDSTDATSESQSSTEQVRPLTHSQWLHQFAEQARRAHMRNIARSLDVDSCPCLPTAASTSAYPDTEYQKPEPALLQVKQPWLTPFRRGCVTTDPKARRVHAHSVVALGDWDADGLFELANKVVGRASEGYTEELILLAPFTRDLVDCLAEDVGTAEAGLFREFVCECLLAEFAVWWDMDLPTSVAMLRYESLWDVTRFFDTAFALATLVGQAFQHGVLPAHAVYQCLVLLVRKLCIIEQVQAVHAIIVHADGALYDGRTLPLLMRVFKFRAMRVPAGTSVLWEPYTRQHVGTYVAEIAASLRAWQKAGPSRNQQRKDQRMKCDKNASASTSPADSACSLQDLDPSDDVISTYPGQQTKRARPAPVLYSDAVKKRKKT